MRIRTSPANMDPCEELLAARPHQMARNLSRHHPGLRHDHCTPPQNDDTEYSRTARGSTRLLQILISESAHLIWVLRCERAMQNKSHTAQEARARWLRQINIRLTDDKIIATKVKRDKASTRLVKDTWEQLLAKDTELPTSWLYSHEVLVGRRP